MLAALSLRAILSSDATIYVLVFALFLSVIASFYVQPGEFSKSRLNVFMTILASVTVILIGLSLSVSSVTLEDQEKVNRATFTKEAIDKLWLYPNELLATSKSARPAFLKSLYPNNLELQAVATKDIEPTVEALMEEQYIAIVMIQAWEDYLTLRDLEGTGDKVWLNNYIQWAQSLYLKKAFSRFEIQL